MSASSSRVPLKSAGIARVLLLVLRIIFATSGLLMALTLLAIALPDTRLALDWLQHQMAIALVLLNLSAPMLAVVWMYRLHQDLQQLYPKYPINAWDALARFILPGYNLWGIWNTLMTLARRWQTEAGTLQQGQKLRVYTYWMYGILVAYSLFSRVVDGSSGSIYRYTPLLSIPPNWLPVVAIAKSIVNLTLAYVLLRIATVIMNAMRLKASQMNFDREA